jgi:hypothetical protein
MCDNGTEECPELTVCDGCMKDAKIKRLATENANLLLLAAASIDADKRISALRDALKDCVVAPASIVEMHSINYLRKRAQDALDKDTLYAR